LGRRGRAAGRRGFRQSPCASWGCAWPASTGVGSSAGVRCPASATQYKGGAVTIPPRTPGARINLGMRKGERKRQLLAHARALLTAEGLSAVTPERVAVAAGVTPSVVGRYFDGPPALLRAVLADVLPTL